MPTPIEPTANDTPKYVVDDSPLKASIITILSLIFFGTTLFGALMRYASIGDLNSIRALLMRDDTIGWLMSVSALLAPPFWLAWRTIKTWFKKTRDVEIAVTSPIAMLKSEVVAAGEIPPPPPTRAREMTTRLVDPIVLHRGGVLAPLTPEPEVVIKYDAGDALSAQTEELASIMGGMQDALDDDSRNRMAETAVRALNPSTPLSAVDFLETTTRKVEFKKPTVVTSRHLDQFLYGLPVDGAADVAKEFSMPGSTTMTAYATNLEPIPVTEPSRPLVVPTPDPAPPSPDLPPPPRQTFDQVEHEFATSGSQDSFLDYLAAKGWRWDQGKRAWVGPGTPPPAHED